MSNVAKMNDVLNPPWARIAARRVFIPWMTNWVEQPLLRR
jgi:hypothetical protein